MNSECYLGKGSTAKAEVLVRVKDTQFDESDHSSFLDARMSLLGAVGNQLGQQDALFHERVRLFQFLHLLCSRRQKWHQHALTRRRLSRMTIYDSILLIALLTEHFISDPCDIFDELTERATICSTFTQNRSTRGEVDSTFPTFLLKQEIWNLHIHQIHMPHNIHRCSDLI